MNEQIEQLLVKGIELKEKKQFSEADKFFTEALEKSQEAKYHHGFLHALFNKGAIWKNLACIKESEDFASLSEAIFTEALAYAMRQDMDEEEIIHAKYLLGQAEVLLSNFSGAIELFTEAYTYYAAHSRSTAHTGDVMRHLGTALFRNGEREEGIKKMDEALRMIRSFDDSYTFANHVWEAGALLGLAEAYKETDSQKAREYTEEALQLSEKNNLSIREDQAKLLLNKLS